MYWTVSFFFFSSPFKLIANPTLLWWTEQWKTSRTQPEFMITTLPCSPPVRFISGQHSSKKPQQTTHLKQGGKGWRAFAWFARWPWNSCQRSVCVSYQSTVNGIWKMEWYQRIFCCYTNQYKSVQETIYLKENCFGYLQNLSLILCVINKNWRRGVVIPTKNTLQIILWIDLDRLWCCKL